MKKASYIISKIGNTKLRLEVKRWKIKLWSKTLWTPYIDYLKSCGYDVYTLYKNDNLQNIVSDEYKAIIISGLDVLSTSGATYEKPPIPIIEAKGHTPEEIHNIIENRYK